MTIKFLKILIYFFLLSNLSIAQELYVCESYTENGTPVGPLNKLDIKPYGTAVYILLDNNKEFKDTFLYLFIDKLIDGKFTPFDSKTLNVKKDAKWAVTSFEFKEEGNYELYFLNSSQNRLATNKIEVHFSEEFKDHIISPSSYSFENDNFTFCELVINGKPINPFNKLSLTHSAGQAYIYINNHVPLGVERIIVNVWKRSKTDKNYEELVDTKKYKILPEWNDTFFKYIFSSIGDFKIDVFDPNENLISSNILTVTK